MISWALAYMIVKSKQYQAIAFIVLTGIFDTIMITMSIAIIMGAK